MNVSAYILLGDPAWIEASVMSYYPYVTKIIATYDCDGRSFTGPKLDVDVCIKRIKAIDRDNKVELVAGKFSDEANFENPMLSETNQRKVGLEIASNYGDWVLQLDTDEIMSNWKVFAAELDYASSNNFDSLYFPSIYVYQLISRNMGLESCRRWGKRIPGYPGPLCVRAGSDLYLARRSRGNPYHVACRRSFNTVIEPHATVSGNTVNQSDCVVHITKGRTPKYMAQKFKTWSHAKDRDYSLDMKYWEMVRTYPWLFLYASHFIPRNRLDKFRLFRIPESVRELIGGNTIDGDVVMNAF